MKDQSVEEAATCTTHKKYGRKIPMPSAEFKPAIPATKRFQTYTLDSMAAGITQRHLTNLLNVLSLQTFGENTNNSNFHARQNEDKFKVRECLLPCGPEFMSSRWIFKNVKFKKHTAPILPDVSYNCETSSLILKE
jgi:hypothetical protein